MQRFGSGSAWIRIDLAPQPTSGRCFSQDKDNWNMNWLRIPRFYAVVRIRNRMDPHWSFHHQAEIVRQIFTSTVCCLLYYFLSLKNDLKVPSKSNAQKIIFYWRLEGHWRKEQDPEPALLVKGMDPRIWIRIHTKMSRFRNSAHNQVRSGIWNDFSGSYLAEKKFRTGINLMPLIKLAAHSPRLSVQGIELAFTRGTGIPTFHTGLFEGSLTEFKLKCVSV